MHHLKNLARYLALKELLLQLKPQLLLLQWRLELLLPRQRQSELPLVQQPELPEQQAQGQLVLQTRDHRVARVPPQAVLQALPRGVKEKLIWLKLK
jgi:hypothetical protein